jgi:hypothetical protein
MQLNPQDTSHFFDRVEEILKLVRQDAKIDVKQSQK